MRTFILFSDHLKISPMRTFRRTAWELPAEKRKVNDPVELAFGALIMSEIRKLITKIVMEDFKYFC